MANSSQGLKNLAFPSPKYYEQKLKKEVIKCI